MMLFYSIAGSLVVLVSLILAKLMPFSRLYKLVVMSIVVVASYIIYMSVGAFPQLRQYQLNQQEKEKITQLLQSMDGKQGLINSIKERLQSEPNSAQGHYLLARLEASEGQWEKAIAHFQTAASIQPNNVNYQVNLAYAQWQGNHNQFNNEVRSMFKKILKQNPDQIDSINMLAMDAYQQKNYDQAMSYWRKLLAIMPPGTEHAKSIEDAIFRAQKAKEG